RFRKAVSARFISAATLAIQRSSRTPSMKQTAAGLPLNGSLVKASIWRRRITQSTSESLHRCRFRIHPSHEEEAEDDHSGEDAVANIPVRAVDRRVVIADHQENQRHRHVRVLTRPKSGLAYGLGVCGVAVLDAADDLLLIRPDHHP